MTRSFVLATFLVSALSFASCQWEVQESHCTANLRGIHSVNGVVAWASGADGTVLRDAEILSRKSQGVAEPVLL